MQIGHKGTCNLIINVTLSSIRLLLLSTCICICKSSVKKKTFIRNNSSRRKFLLFVKRENFSNVEMYRNEWKCLLPAFFFFPQCFNTKDSLQF